MGRVLGIDFGTKRIGLARSDLSRLIASPLKTIQAGKTLDDTIKLILQELTDIEQIVVGLPLLLSGKDSETTQQVRRFAHHLHTVSQLPVALFDERLTTTQVENLLKEQRLSRKKRAKHLDVMSATLILQTYLDRNHHANS